MFLSDIHLWCPVQVDHLGTKECSIGVLDARNRFSSIRDPCVHICRIFRWLGADQVEKCWKSRKKWPEKVHFQHFVSEIQHSDSIRISQNPTFLKNMWELACTFEKSDFDGTFPFEKKSSDFGCEIFLENRHLRIGSRESRISGKSWKSPLRKNVISQPEKSFATSSSFLTRAEMFC
jgi:hypothetical protein